MSSKTSPTDDTFHDSDTRYSGTTLHSARFQESTHLIPSPGSQGGKHKTFVSATIGPFWQSLVIQFKFIVGTSYYEASGRNRYAIAHVGTRDWARGCDLGVKQKPRYVPTCDHVILALQLRTGFKVPQSNVFDVFGDVSAQFLAVSGFPILLLRF